MPWSKRKATASKRNATKYKRHNKSSAKPFIYSIPSISSSIDQKGAWSTSLEYLTQQSYVDCNRHKAFVCVLCDCFIKGSDTISYVKPSTLHVMF